MRIQLTAYLLLLYCASAVLAIQAPPTSTDREHLQERQTFRSAVDVVRIDVAVTDSRQHHVPRLGIRDFLVTENGTKAEVLDVEEIVLAADTESSSVVSDDVSSNQLPNRGRLVVLLIDDVLTPSDARIIKTTKEIARRAISSLGPDDLGAVTFTGNSAIAQAPTKNRSKLLAAVDAFAPFSVSMEGVSLRTLQMLVESLNGVSGLRKAIFYISVGDAIDFQSANQPRLTTLTESATGLDVIRDQINLLTSTMTDAVSSRTAVYAFDPSGLDGQEALNVLPKSGGGRVASTNIAMLRRDFLKTLAENTGGRAITSTNTPEAYVSGVLEEIGSYYIISYRSALPSGAPEFRRLSVTTTNHQFQAHTQKGYFRRPSRTQENDVSQSARLDRAMAGVLPNPAVPLQIWAGVFPAGVGKPEDVIVAIQVEQPSPLERQVEKLELRVQAFDLHGKVQASSHQLGRVTLLPTYGQTARYEVLTALALPKGVYQLRAAVATSAGVGSVFQDLVVAAREPAVEARLSSIALSATPGLPSATIDDALIPLPVRPTSVRQFEQGSIIQAFVSCEGNPNCVDAGSLRAELANSTGKIVWSQNTFSASGAIDRRRPIIATIPTDELSPGRYVLTFSAGLSRPVSSSVTFFVK